MLSWIDETRVVQQLRYDINPMLIAMFIIVWGIFWFYLVRDRYIGGHHKSNRDYLKCHTLLALFLFMELNRFTFFFSTNAITLNNDYWLKFCVFISSHQTGMRNG